MITAAEGVLFLWVLAPTQVEAAPIASATSAEVLPVIVVTTHRRA